MLHLTLSTRSARRAFERSDNIAAAVEHQSSPLDKNRYTRSRANINAISGVKIGGGYGASALPLVVGIGFLVGPAVAQQSTPPTAPSPVQSALVQSAPAAPTPAAADLCVMCEEPPARYRCRAERAEPNAPPAQGLQIKCVTEISRDRGHGRCRIDKSTLGEACSGTFVAVSAPPPALPGSAPQEIAKPTQAAAPAVKKPPETMEALAKEAAKQSSDAVKETSDAAGRSIDKATTAVGGALQKSWNCVSSLFARC